MRCKWGWYTKDLKMLIQGKVGRRKGEECETQGGSIQRKVGKEGKGRFHARDGRNGMELWVRMKKGSRAGAGR